MCGLLGFASIQTLNDAESILKGMSQQILHRGPDDAGVFVGSQGRYGFAHQRLAIQDLSALGHQPMQSSKGRYIAVYNGEVYNFKVLQKELEQQGFLFKGHSDTEVLLAGFEAWGIKETIARASGMFAIVVVDLKLEKLYLIRDRFGEKPLYYSFQNSAFLFGSELHALKAFPGFNNDINRDSLVLLLRHNFIPAPHSIYKNTYKLLPGHMVEIDLNRVPTSPSELVIEQYWSAAQVTENTDISFQEAHQETERLLHKCIQQQLISDAPLGAFLSGGIDSSTVVAVAQQQSLNPINTFSIGFSEKGFNEAEHAKAVAKHLGTAHKELYISANDTLDVIPNIPQIYDEPFADSSQLPTYLLCKMAKQSVTVALSGDGGDELFCGYTRYFNYQKRLNSRSWQNSLKQLGYQLPLSLQLPIARAFHKNSRALSKDSLLEKLKQEKALTTHQVDAFYKQAISINAFPESMVLGAKEPSYAMDCKHSNTQPDALTIMMMHDINCYMPDDILVKVDRAAMANSLETRVPLLNHELAEFALSLPAHLNVTNQIGKQVLRSVLYKYVPQALIDRPKVGFAIPIDEWLRGPLKDWCLDLLAPDTIKQQGYFNTDVIARLVSEHMTGIANNGYRLWGVLMFQQWLEHQGM